MFGVITETEWAIKSQDNYGCCYCNYVVAPSAEEAISFFREYTRGHGPYKITEVSRLHRVHRPEYKSTQ